MCCLILVIVSASPALGVGANKGMPQKEVTELKQGVHPLARGQGFVSGTENHWQVMAMAEVLWTFCILACFKFPLCTVSTLFVVCLGVLSARTGQTPGAQCALRGCWLCGGTGVAAVAVNVDGGRNKKEQKEGAGNQKESPACTQCGARTHDHKIKSLALCRLS